MGLAHICAKVIGSAPCDIQTAYGAFILSRFDSWGWHTFVQKSSSRCNVLLKLLTEQSFWAGSMFGGWHTSVQKFGWWHRVTLKLLTGQSI